MQAWVKMTRNQNAVLRSYMKKVQNPLGKKEFFSITLGKIQIRQFVNGAGSSLCSMLDKISLL